ncbi:MAG: hypothetical protein R3F11_23595 [Verrucomicrobiales bacterium]
MVALITRAVGHVVPQAKLNEMIQYTRDRRAAACSPRFRRTSFDRQRCRSTRTDTIGPPMARRADRRLPGGEDAIGHREWRGGDVDQRGLHVPSQRDPRLPESRVNRLTVRAYSGKNGTGEVVDTG